MVNDGHKRLVGTGPSFELVIVIGERASRGRTSM